MKIYKWDSEFLRDYSQGMVLVAAESIEDARKKVVKKFEDDQDSTSDEYQSELLILMEDIECEPEILDVLFLTGSQ